MLDLTDTIAAIASAAGDGIRGILRISGPGSGEVLQRLLARELTAPSLVPVLETGRHDFRPRAFEAELECGGGLGLIPARIHFWPGPRSYTGEPAAEIHTIGAGPILDQLLLHLQHECGVRIAERGEFTLRAFLAGRIDLTQAEGVLGVIEAQTREGLGTALDQLTGGISAPLERLRTQLIELLADVEAGLDFVEEDLTFLDRETLVSRLRTAQQAVQQLAHKMDRRGRAGDLPRVILRGLPNAGKSSLLNTLAGKNVAIVSAQSGTTRDPVESRCQVGGTLLRIVDTAGLEEHELLLESASEESIRLQAQSLAGAFSDRAEVCVWCADGTQQPLARPEDFVVPFSGTQSQVLRVATKSDLLTQETLQSLRSAGWLPVSVRTGEGIDLLREMLARTVTGDQMTAGTVACTAVRCRGVLLGASADLLAALRQAELGGHEELLAADLRMAIEKLGQVTGKVYTEEILDSIFSRFCIGK